MNNVWAQGYVFDHQPWDVSNDNRLVYILGQSHSADWCAATALDGATGVAVVVPNWRTHIMRAGNTQFRGVAGAAPGGIAAVSYSNIIFKKVGRCDLRSWTSADYLAERPDGNGRTRQGTWPLDAFFGTPCDPTAPSTSGNSYTGYSTGPGATYGVSSVVIDHRTNACYIGFNVQTVLPGGQPDFEPAVLALAATGELRWWSRLYHERSAPNSAYPLGQPVNSTPDQYVDGLAVDYSQPAGDLVVLARCHGNNVENFWHGNAVAAVPTAQGFQLTLATSPLPVQLISFAAARTSSTTAALVWETATERGNNRFVVEKSLDGRTFRAIATSPGSGSSTTRCRYNYTDPIAPTAAYYRLAQYDAPEGPATYSPVTAVAAPATTAALLVLAPNPAHDLVRVWLPAPFYAKIVSGAASKPTSR